MPASSHPRTIDPRRLRDDQDPRPQGDLTPPTFHRDRQQSPTWSPMKLPMIRRPIDSAP